MRMLLPLVTTMHAVTKSSIMMMRTTTTTTTTTTSTQESSSSTAAKKNLPPVIPLTYLEFYAGVGGWRMALQEAVRSYSARHAQPACCDESSPAAALFSLHQVAALDHSDLCLDVYRHQKYGHNTDAHDVDSSSSSTTFSNKACRIEHLEANQIRAWQTKAATTNALPQHKFLRDGTNNIATTTDIWMMSPPCQPHTRQHSNQATDVQDPRSQSFLHLCQLLRDNCKNDDDDNNNNNNNNTNKNNSFSIPKLIFLENVIGFEQSESCQTWRRVLHECGYRMGHFHLTPTQVGLPNDRPRYFCLAVQENAICQSNCSSIDDWSNRYLNDTPQKQEQQQVLQIHTSIPELNVHPVAVVDDNADMIDDDSLSLPCIRDFLDDRSSSSSKNSNNNSSNHSQQNSLQVPRNILERNASWCFDIVHADSRRSACFTSSYGKYVKGTGSILYEGKSTQSNSNNNSNDEQEEKSGSFSFDLVRPQEREFDEEWMESLDTNMLRYFSGSEMARLFGFPSEFDFPPGISMKQQWKLMGNSLNVRLAARLIELGLLLIINKNNDKHG